MIFNWGSTFNRYTCVPCSISNAVELRAAVRIQAVWRGLRARRLLVMLRKEKMQQRLHTAAVTIQVGAGREGGGGRGGGSGGRERGGGGGERGGGRDGIKGTTFGSLNLTNLVQITSFLDVLEMLSLILHCRTSEGLL